MMQSADDSPIGLVKPKVAAKKMSGIWLAMAGAAGGIMFVVLFFGIFGSEKSPVEEQRKEQPKPTADSKPLAESPKGSGLVGFGELPQQVAGRSELPPKTVPLTAQQQALLQEREQLRQMRQQMQLQAMQAPLTVSTNSSQQNRQTSTHAIAALDQQVSPKGAGVGDSPASQHYDTSDRKDKEAFLTSRSKQDNWQLGQTRVAGAACEIKTGTVIPGIMLTGINSDLPGKIIGQVSQNVFDTATGDLLIIPQGSRLIGVYDSRVAVGQNRVLIAWNRIIFPDGSSVDIESMPGTDQAGYAGFEDQIDNHYFRIFGSATIMSLIGGGMAYSVDSLKNNSNSTTQNTNNNSTPSLRDEMGTALAAQLGQASLQLLQQNVNIKPTLEIRPGFRFNIVLVKDIVFDSPYTPMR